MHAPVGQTGGVIIYTLCIGLETERVPNLEVRHRPNFKKNANTNIEKIQYPGAYWPTLVVLVFSYLTQGHNLACNTNIELIKLIEWGIYTRKYSNLKAVKHIADYELDQFCLKKSGDISTI